MHPDLTHPDWNVINTILLFLLTIIATLAKAELHDIKKRVVRMEDAFIKAGSQFLFDQDPK